MLSECLHEELNYVGMFVLSFILWGFLSCSDAALAKKDYQQPVIDRIPGRLRCSLAAISQDLTW